MQNRMKHALQIVLGVMFLMISSLAYAKAILNIVPTNTSIRSIKLAATGSTYLIYSVTNNTKITINKLRLDPGYNTSGSLTLTVKNNACTGALAAGASCRFGLQVQGKGLTTSSVLMPRVCEYTSGTCSVPIEANRINVAAGGVGKSIAYIVNSAANGPVSICPIDSTTGAIGACTAETGNGTFFYPQGLAVNAQDTVVFITNYGTTNISICPVIQDGSGRFGVCTTSDGNGTFFNPNGAALNPANTMLYIANNGANLVSICGVTNNGTTLGTCTTSDGNGTFSNIQGITLNADATYAYICNDSSISICPINQNGTLGTCTTSTGNGTFAFPQGVSFSADNTTAYIGNFSNNTVSICPILQNGSGGFGTCTAVNGNGTFNFSSNDVIGLFMLSPTAYGYIPNNGNNTISICPITTSYTLGTCVVSSDATYNQPTMVGLSYVIS